jgi:hypothetical protein
MDDEQGYPYFLGNLHMIFFCWIAIAPGIEQQRLELANVLVGWWKANQVKICVYIKLSNIL